MVCGTGTSDVADRNLLTGRVRYYGDDIAAVVAEDEIIAARALKLIKVEYENIRWKSIHANLCMAVIRRFILIKR